MTLLVTGFGPFPGVATNPSGLAVERLARDGLDGITTQVLPTEFHACFQTLAAAARDHDVSGILMLGVAQEAPALRLERFALNWIEGGRPDAAGVALDEPVVREAPLAYASTLPLEEIAGTLRDARVPFELSAHAGTYVCNCLFFRCLHEQARASAPVPAGFVHIPMPRDLDHGAPDAPSLAELCDWLRPVLRTLLERS